MSALIFSRKAQTVQDGRMVPEDQVARGSPEAGLVFQVREAVTVRQGRPSKGDPEEPPGVAFQVREAVTTVLPPPYWADLPPAETPEAPIKPASEPAGGDGNSENHKGGQP